MFTITRSFTSDYRIKGSKFLGYLCPADSAKAADTALEQVKNEHPTATHHCYGWRIDPNKPEEFSQDDGEPGGTAGLPILNAMKSAELMNAVIIVVRYYGGTKLGKSGLIEAYGHAASLCIKAAELNSLISIRKFKIVYDYEHQGFIDKLKNDFTWFELEAGYLEKITLVCGCPVEEAERFLGAIQHKKHEFDEFEDLGKSWVIT